VRGTRPKQAEEREVKNRQRGTRKKGKHNRRRGKKTEEKGRVVTSLCTAARSFCP
jgi:hypothetical protein